MSYVEQAMKLICHSPIFLLTKHNKNVCNVHVISRYSFTDSMSNKLKLSN